MTLLSINGLFSRYSTSKGPVYAVDDVDFQLDTDWIDSVIENMFNCLQQDNAPTLDKEACEQCLYRETYQDLKDL